MKRLLTLRLAFAENDVVVLQGNGKFGMRKQTSGDAHLSSEDLRTRLHAELSTEDPYNGEMVIRNIGKPFTVPSEVAEIQSWQI